EIGGELGVGGGFAGAQQGLDNEAVLFGREKPVAGEADYERIRFDTTEGVVERAVGGGEVELVEGAGDVEVGVGVEAVDEAAALIAQVALDLELHVEGGRTGGEGRGERGGGRRGGAVGDLAAAEFAVHGRVGEVGDVGHHAGDGQADARAGAGGVVAVVPLGVLHDGLTADLVEGDGLRAFAGGGG